MSRYMSSVLTCEDRREGRVKGSDSAILSGVGVWSRLGKDGCSPEPSAAASPGQLSCKVDGVRRQRCSAQY